MKAFSLPTFNFSELNFNTNFQPMQRKALYSDEKQRYQPDQKLFLDRHLNKNVLMVMLPYLRSNESISLILTSKQIYSKLTSDPYFFQIMNESYLNFFLYQFRCPLNEFVVPSYMMRMSSSSNTTNSSEHEESMMNNNKKQSIKALLGGNTSAQSEYQKELEQFIEGWSVTNYQQQS